MHSITPENEILIFQYSTVTQKREEEEKRKKRREHAPPPGPVMPGSVIFCLSQVKTTTQNTKHTHETKHVRSGPTKQAHLKVDLVLVAYNCVSEKKCTFVCNAVLILQIQS